MLAFMQQPTIETERLVLRPFTVKDAGDVQLLAGERKVADMTLTIPHPYRDGMAESWISTHSDSWENRTAVSYAITIKDSKQLIGTVSLSKIKGTYAELGYWIGVPFWNMGYCSEAASALIEFAARAIEVTCVRAVHLTSNPASGRVMQKMGMIHVDRGQTLDRDGLMADIEIYETTNI